MVSLSFSEKLLIEQVRGIEEAGAISTVEPNSSVSSMSFENSLLQRSESISNHPDHRNINLSHAEKLSRRCSLGLCALSTVAGSLAVLQAINTSDTTINIYWLIIVLLGINLISLVLWFTGIVFLRPSASNHGVLSSIWQWIEPRITPKKHIQAAADKAWFYSCHHGAIGRWWLSSLSHGVWITYLASSFIVLLLLLMTRQFDFVWATTILSNDVFLTLTQQLATPLNWIGITTPNVEQVQLSRYGIEHNTHSELRQLWATFLLGGVFVYGILPRVVLFIFSKMMQTIAKQQFQLDFSLPYYINLRHQLTPSTTPGKIVDPDLEQKTIDANTYHEICNTPIPSNANWIAVELTDDIEWPQSTIKHNLGHVTGSTTKAMVLDKLKGKKNKPLLIAVSGLRLPDRGLKRTLLDLYAMTPQEQRWLAIFNPSADTHNDKGLINQRLDNWRNVAGDCKIPAHNLIVIQNSSL